MRLFLKSILTIGLIGISFMLYSEVVDAQVNQNEELIFLQKKVIKIEREKRLLEDRAMKLQFERRKLQEAKNIFDRISYLQLELNVINEKMARIEKDKK